MKAPALITLLALTGCATPDQNARSLLDRLEFEEGERGCAELRASIDLNPLPLVTTAASLILKKDTCEGAPSC